MARPLRNPPETPTEAAPQAIEASPPPVPAVIIPPEVTDYVAQWVIAGYSSHTIEQGIARLYPDYRLEDVTRSLWDHFVRQGETPHAFRRGQLVEMCRELYRVALAEGELELALKAIKMLADLTK